MLSLVLMYLSTRNKKIYTVMGMVDSKDFTDCIKTIAPQSERLFPVDGFAPNAVPACDIENLAGFYTESEISSSLTDAVEKAKTLALENDGIVVVCGSLYLASEYLNNTEK